MIKQQSWELLHNLLWPAGAGGVGWALITTAIELVDPGCHTLARTVAILLIAIYLAAQWVTTNLAINKYDAYNVALYTLFDFLHLISILAFTVSLEKKPDLACPLLVTALALSMIGHWVGAFRPNGDKFAISDLSLGLCSAVGLLILASPYVLPQIVSPDSVTPWLFVAAIAIALALWLFAKFLIHISNCESQRHHEETGSAGDTPV